jgi:membrane-associated phospholipid phosphatase
VRGPAPAAPTERPVETRLGFLPADVLSIGYLVITSTLVVLGRGRLPHWGTWLTLHLAFLVVVIGLRWVPRRGLPGLQLVRETYALWLLPFAYASLERLNRIATEHYYDDVVLRWDHRLFTEHPHTRLMAALPWQPLSEFLHLSYLVYQILVPILGFTLFFQKRFEALRVMATTMVFTMYTCYLIFIFFPVLGPYYTFPRPEGGGQGLFPALVDAMLNAGASRGTAFPSSHVAGSVAVAILAHRFSRRLSYALVVLALSIMFATVYGAFHYAVDACAGFAFGVLSALLGPRIHAWLLRRTRLHLVRFRFPHLRFRWRGRFRGEIVRINDQR